MKEKVEQFKKILSPSYVELVASQNDTFFVLKKKNQSRYYEIKNQIFQHIKQGESINEKLFNEFMGLLIEISDDVSDEYYKMHYKIVNTVFAKVKKNDFSFENYSLEALLHRSVGDCFEKVIPKNLNGISEGRLRNELFTCSLQSILDYVQDISPALKKKNNFKMSYYAMIVISGRIVMTLGYDISRGKKAAKEIEPTNSEIHKAFEKMALKRTNKPKK